MRAGWCQRLKKTWLWVMFLLLAGLLAALFLLGRGDIRLFQEPSGSPPLPPPDSLIQARCEYVTDGDTAWFRVAENGVSLSHKVRFLNIDAPESGAPGFTEASGHVRAALAGKTVFLEYDSQRLDRYGRQLCHVWLPDGTLFNLELVSLGLARALVLQPNDRYAGYFEAAERGARARGAGIWAD